MVTAPHPWTGWGFAFVASLVSCCLGVVVQGYPLSLIALLLVPLPFGLIYAIRLWCCWQQHADGLEERIDNQSRVIGLLEKLRGEARVKAHKLQHREQQSQCQLEQTHARHIQELQHYSHELRTASTGLSDAVDILDPGLSQCTMGILSVRDNIDDPMLFKRLSQANEHARQLFVPLDDFLKPTQRALEGLSMMMFEKLEANGGVTLINQPFSVQQQLLSILAPARTSAKHKRLLLNVMGLGQEPSLNVIGDEYRFGQVVTCLVNNAIEFTSAGRVSVELRTLPVCGQGGESIRLRVVVTDSGQGMNDQQRDAALQALAIEEGSDSNPKQGLGTGLSMASSVAKHMGGEVMLSQTQLGQGSSFVFDVTLPRAQAPRPTSTATSGAAPDLSLLYVEDSSTNRAAFKLHCRKRNVNLQMAIDGLEGWESYLSCPYDAIVIDLVMPRCDGFELAERIRAHEKEHGLPRMPLFALTATPRESSRQRALAAGYDGFFAKPYKLPAFEHIVELTRVMSTKHKALTRRESRQ